MCGAIAFGGMCAAGAIDIMGTANQSTHFTLLTVPSLLRTIIFTCHSFSHFGRCQAARLLPPPDEGGEPG